MKKSVLLLILTAMAITASACNGSDVTGTMTMNSSAKQETKNAETAIAGNETSQNTTTTSSAVTELDNMLNEINTDVQPGTAGSSLKAVKVAANLLDWGTETSLSQEEIKSETVRWLSDKGNDEQAELICTPGIRKPEPISHISRQMEMEKRLEEEMVGIIMMTRPELIYPGKRT